MIARTFDKDALLDLVTEAQEYLNTAIERIDEYVRRSGDHAAEAYILDHLKIMAGSNHGFLGGDLNLDDIIEQLNQFEAEDDDE